MVVTAHRIATDIGVDVLRRGGNAIDAAVAIGYALAVVYPAAGNLGGGGFMTLEMADGTKSFIDFREKAPLAASASMYLDAKGDVIRGLSTDGYLAAGVPGTVAGLEYARSHYGTLPGPVLIAPAIHLAEEGFILDQGDVEVLRYASEDLRRDPPAAAIFLKKDGSPYLAGERLVQKDLGMTLRQISLHGPAGFYSGPVGEAIVRASQAGHGIFSEADLAQYQPRERPPVECDYRGYHVITAPPPSSGGAVLCEMLNIVEAYPLGSMGYGSAQAVHLEIEAMRHAYLDRNTYLGDPDFVDNPVTRLISKDYAARIRQTIDPNRAGQSDELRPGVAPHEGTNTTHYSIIDAKGNAVAVTYTLNNWFGARVVAAGTGVLLNDEMDDFTSKIGVANSYRLVQGEANLIAPGKRPLSSMTPTIVTRQGKPVIVLGTPGGSRITTSVFLALLNLIDYKMTVQEAVDMPRFHQQWLPGVTRLERFALSPDTQHVLEAMGHQFAPMPEGAHLAAILVGAPSLEGAPVGENHFYGANDPRGHTGLALGF
jgi:gamma-glutamyltranspeptidase/glutathione hydrolase